MTGTFPGRHDPDTRASPDSSPPSGTGVLPGRRFKRSPEDPPPVSRILIVEDEQDLANLLTYNLSAAGFETETSHSGAAALSRAKAFKPDLVLLDLMLPDLPGSEVLRLIKEDPNLRRTAVVMVTAKGQESDRVQGLEMGADDYVVKPFS